MNFHKWGFYFKKKKYINKCFSWFGQVLSSVIRYWKSRNIDACESHCFQNGVQNGGCFDIFSHFLLYLSLRTSDFHKWCVIWEKIKLSTIYHVLGVWSDFRWKELALNPCFNRISLKYWISTNSYFCINNENGRYILIGFAINNNIGLLKSFKIESSKSHHNIV